MFKSPDRQFEGCHILVVQLVDLEKSLKSLSLVTRVVSIMSVSEINSKNEDLLPSQCIGSTIHEYLGILFPASHCSSQATSDSSSAAQWLKH